MRRIATILLLLTTSCHEAERPEDGTVDAYESCLWEGQQLTELCQSHLECAAGGLCLPKCDTIDSCQVFEGFYRHCGGMGTTKGDVCILGCSPAMECPDIEGTPDGYELTCIAGFVDGGWCELK